jgi:hypothetical protein
MPESSNDIEESESDGVGLYWVALYLVDLVYGGPEEGGWWYQGGTLVVSPEAYYDIGGAPAAFVERGDAIAYRERLEPNLAALNAGRPPIEATNSVGIYELRLMRAQLLPAHFPDQQPHYE